MLPDSRRPRRLAIVISAIDDERDLDLRTSRSRRDDRLDLARSPAAVETATVIT